MRVMIAIVVALLAACGSSEDAELKQASSVILWMSAPMNLQRSMFSAAYPDCKPSEFVAFIFSQMGSAEWPPSIEEAENDPTVRDQTDAVRMPLVPQSVAFVAHKIDPAKGKQLVITFDDERRVVIVTAYLDPASEPQFIREFTLERVTPAPGVREMFQSNVETGMGYGK